MPGARPIFESLVNPIYDYLNQTTARVPLVDSYETDNARSDGMHARSVVGGIFIKLLSDPGEWKKWSRGDRQKVGGWAPLPESPKVVEVVPTSRNTPVNWRYTVQAPPEGWTQPGFDAGGWQEGLGGFGTSGTPGAVVRTRWDTGDIWLRRQFVMPAGAHPNLQFDVYHDEDVEIYVNGVLAASEAGYTTTYGTLEPSPASRALLQPGASITLAVHCHQTTGGQDIDVGLADVIEAPDK